MEPLPFLTGTPPLGRYQLLEGGKVNVEDIAIKDHFADICSHVETGFCAGGTAFATVGKVNIFSANRSPSDSPLVRSNFP